MSLTIAEVKDNLSGLLHGQDVDTVENIEFVFERAANSLLSRIDPLETMRVAPLASAIHDDFFDYALPSDFKKPISLYPQDSRDSTDYAKRQFAEEFDLEKEFLNKNISIESREGTKIIRINWKSRPGKVLNAMDSLTTNGTWSAVATASGLKANSIFKVTGNASIEFDLAATGDGIENSGMTAVDMTDEDEVADVFMWVYLGVASNISSISARWGNDLTTNYWSSVAQTTQADGTAFKVGWNLIKFPWSTATETGTVDPTLIDSFRLTVATLAVGAVANIRVDNIVFSIGRNFDLSYYSKYLFKTSAGVWIPRPTSDSDVVVLDTDAIQIFHLENIITAAQQEQNASLSSDVTWAKKELLGEDLRGETGLYAKYKKEHPDQPKKVTSRYYELQVRRRGVGGFKNTAQ